MLWFSVFIEELSSFKVSCEHGIFGSLLFNFNAIFVRINIFLIKILIHNYLSHYKMHQFSVPNRRNAIKKTISALIGKFTIKNIRILFESCFFLEKCLHFFYITKRIVTLHIQVPLMTILIYSSRVPNDQNISFQGIAPIFLGFDFVFVFFNQILFFFEILPNF